MTDHPVTDYFRENVLTKRPYIRMEWCTETISLPLRREILMVPTLCVRTRSRTLCVPNRRSGSVCIPTQSAHRYTQLAMLLV
jgi:hypothetical protein